MANPQADQDTPWKLILEQFFPECLLFFFPAVYEAIDWSQPHEFLDKELQQVAKDAALGRRYADKLVKVHLKEQQQELWILLHVEVQSHREAEFAHRMYTYHHRLSDRYQRPIVSMAILCDPSPSWRPTQYTKTILGCHIEFRFLTTKLLDYRSRWSELEQETNPFATVVMAHLKAQETRRNHPQRQTWKLYLVRRLYEKGYERLAIIHLFQFIDWILTLPEDLDQGFWKQVEAYEEERRMPYITSVERIGIAKGRQEGLEQGQQQHAIKVLLQILQHRSFPISKALQARLQKLTIEQLDQAITQALSANSLAEFTATLPKVSTPRKAANKQPEGDL